MNPFSTSNGDLINDPRVPRLSTESSSRFGFTRTETNQRLNPIADAPQI